MVWTLMLAHWTWWRYVDAKDASEVVPSSQDAQTRIYFLDASVKYGYKLPGSMLCRLTRVEKRVLGKYSRRPACEMIVCM